MDNKELTIYDKTQLYEETILPLIKEIKKVCKLNNVPFFITTAVKNTHEKTFYENDGNLTGSNSINLKKDNFKNIIKVIHGVELKPIGSIDYDEELSDFVNNFDGDLDIV